MDEGIKKKKDNTNNLKWLKQALTNDKEINYGKRIAILEKTACKLLNLRTTNFSEVICFVMRCHGVDAREELEGLLKLHLEEKMPPVKISARKRVKLKCSYGGTWSQLYKLCAANYKVK